MADVKEAALDKLRLLQLENEWLSLSILPEVGAKILTLFDKHAKRNLLWENPRIRPQTYPIDANFDNYWCGGWDDAYPSADACIYKGEPIPNVGELRLCTGPLRISRRMRAKLRQHFQRTRPSAR
jgi:hypothetical protein